MQALSVREVDVELPMAAATGLRVAIEKPVMTLGAKPAEKPTLETVVEYGRSSIEVYLSKHASDIPREQKDEIRQNAMVRICEAYAKIDESRGWKAFVQHHCRGAVLDYIRDGKGFEESNWAFASSEEDAPEERSKKSSTLRTRISVMHEDGDSALDVEECAGIHGVFKEDSDAGFTFFTADGEEVNLRPNWPLIARMASVDENLHLVAKVILGFTQTEQASDFGVSRERLTQRLREFFDMLDDPRHLNSKWVAQTIYALGMWDFYHMTKQDMGVGWDLQAVDLLSESSAHLAEALYQPSFQFGPPPDVLPS